jgi:hypothetical protein
MHRGQIWPAAIVGTAWLYSAACLIAILLRRKIARTMMLIFFGLAFLADIGVTALLWELHDLGSAGFVPPIFRGGIEFALFLYFVRSQRVRQTLVN